MRMSRATKKAYPLSMRLPRADISLIDRAATLRGRSRTDFVRDAAVRAAEEVLLDSLPIRMSARGFAALTAVVPATMPRSIRTGQPPDPIPCFLLGQLATDRAWAGKGIANGLLKHALERCVAAAHLVGGRALVVNAVDDEAAAFWRRRGFQPSKDDPMVLFRSIADIAASLLKAAGRR